GTTFSAAAPEDSSLAMAPPESFGFLGRSLATVSVEGSPGSSLTLAPQSTLLLAGNGVYLKDTGITLPSGNLLLSSLPGKGSVLADGTIQSDVSSSSIGGVVSVDGTSFGGFEPLGEVEIRGTAVSIFNGSLIGDFGAPAGRVAITSTA